MLLSLLPIGDDNSDRLSRPIVTPILIGINVLVFVLLQLPSQAFTNAFSVIPFNIWTGQNVSHQIPVGPNEVLTTLPGPSPVYLTILTAMFMHGGWAHLGGNMLYLYIFGDNVEDAMGRAKFLIFYLLCGLLATLAHVYASVAAGGINPYVPSLGASGAIAGVLGAYIVLFPRKVVYVLFGWFGLVAVPAVLVIGAWLVLQFFSGVSSQFVPREVGGGVAYWAHVGGAVAGVVLVWLFRSPRVQSRVDGRLQRFENWRGY